MEGQREEKAPQKRVVVITDRETADGFLLSGTELRAFDNAEEGAREIERLLHDTAIKAILANEEFLEALDERTRRLAEESPIVVIELPAQRGGLAMPAHEDLLKMINRLKPQF
ncbi:MAG: V-type ATP synthase subunit F [Actinobacteria bacterium]|nr:V-type ATP synthase subunit F [Actinomycetota bacterium]MBU1944320.1 V-type ATP synthase subunit F [Actinomycetota bacterium]MBU2688305.1 V-type ATP synthase subunit F [Actinomycetota bacterium]